MQHSSPQSHFQQLQGKRIIVTGAARGIGAGTVRAFVRAGAQVAALDINAEGGRAATAEANAQGEGSATFYPCDIANPEQVFAVFAEAERAMGGLDVLAHIAAIEEACPAEEFTLNDMNRTWGININGTVLTNQAACKLMQKQGKGAIINFASDVALSGMPNSALYAASKGAVLSWTRTIAYEWALKFNIRCNCINPTIKTPMYEAWLANLTDEQRQAHLANEKRQVPLGGAMGDIDKDMAPVMVFMASDASGFINGQIVPVNGGRNMLRG
ncbi:SDR family oxidoreductase [Halioxenophilus sp. WMMB6]|uniref:SDR family NAD(P)-dependent oxidoreductase n=1 Tax=Halioxenophilus sp. WMMB6 TaxID=3073815 RepID=UPI00295EB060|nr:SDR family oxidoreductase [Halioxenophilus sp. WMMB6]